MVHRLTFLTMITQGAALYPIQGSNDAATQTVFVATADHARHRWVSATRVQLDEHHRVLHTGAMFATVLDLLREPGAPLPLLQDCLLPALNATTHEPKGARQRVPLLSILSN